MTSCLHYHEGCLQIENLRLEDIAAEFGTPCYIYSQAALEKNWDLFNQGLNDLPHQICYAVKANSNLAILNFFARRGAGFDIVSIGELQRVIAAGGDPGTVVFSGVGKSYFEIEEALKLGIQCFNVESTAELQRINAIAAAAGTIANIAFRVNPDIDPDTHFYISTGLKENKFGMAAEEIFSICLELKKYPAVKLTGIACHIGSQLTSIEPFKMAINFMLNLYYQLQKQKIHLDHIDIGGGLGIFYQNEQPPSIETYTQILKDAFKNQPIRLMLEPGRALVGNAGCLLTRIEYLKMNSHKNFVIVDAGMNDFLRPALYQAWQAILPCQQRQTASIIYDIVGPVCESSDFLGKERKLAVQAGDLLAIDMAGAYGASMTSNYNSRCRPVEIMVHANKAMLIRRRESIQDLFAHESIPCD